MTSSAETPVAGESLADAYRNIHGWFGLTYANYLVLERSILQSMPDEWQQRFVACLAELDGATREMERAPGFRVHSVNEHGQYMHDPVPPYDRGRTRVELAKVLVAGHPAGIGALVEATRRFHDELLGDQDELLLDDGGVRVPREAVARAVHTAVQAGLSGANPALVLDDLLDEIREEALGLRF
jgi:hypothetical protein